MLQIKPLLELTGLNVKEGGFIKPPPLPYIVFSEEEQSHGSDYGNEIIERHITIELYADTIDKENEKKIIDLLKQYGIHYAKFRQWIATEKFWQTIVEFDLTEKENTYAES